MRVFKTTQEVRPYSMVDSMPSEKLAPNTILIGQDGFEEFESIVGGTYIIALTPVLKLVIVQSGLTEEIQTSDR